MSTRRGMARLSWPGWFDYNCTNFVQLHNKAQYTPPTRRNCRVKSRRLCVRNSQLIGHRFDIFEQICQQRVELRRVGAVNAAVGSRRELVANCVYTADADAPQLDSRVGVGGVYWA